MLWLRLSGRCCLEKQYLDRGGVVPLVASEPKAGGILAVSGELTNQLPAGSTCGDTLTVSSKVFGGSTLLTTVEAACQPMPVGNA